MDGKASSNDKVSFDYYVTACVQAEEADCTAVLREYSQYGYLYVTTIYDGENALVVYKKPKDKTSL